METNLYDPELFELTHCGNPGDKEFYARLGGPKRSVLELGCGTGRVGMAMLESGSRYVGIDAHPGMLERFAEKLAEKADVAGRAELVSARMEDFRLDREFDLVFAPYNALFCLLSARELVGCLKSAHAHLRVGGRFVFDVYYLAEDEVDDEGIEEDDEPELIAHLTDGVREIDVMEMDFVDWKNKRIDVSYIYLIREGGRLTEKTYTLPHRFWLHDELVSSLGECGFAVEEVYGDFSGGRLDEDSEQLIIVATKV